MATRKRTIGDVGLPFKEDPKKDVLFAKPTDPPGGNVTTEQQWQDQSTIDENRLNEISDAIDKDNSTPSYANYPERDDNSPSGYIVKTGGGVKGSRNKDAKAEEQGYGVGVDGNAGASGVGKGSVVNPNGIVDNANSQVSAVTSGEDKPDMYRMKLQQMIDELDARHKARMEENDNDLRRSQRNRLMTAIGDGLNAMHRAYTHSRGVQPMPGSERQMSKEWQDRYDRLKAERDRLNKDYLAEQLRIMQHGTAQQRADAYKEWMTREGDAKQKNAATRATTAQQENDRKNRKLEQDLKNAQAEIKKKEEEINKLKAQTKAIEEGRPTSPRSSSGGGNSGGRGNHGNGNSSSSRNNSGGSGKKNVGERAGAARVLDPNGWSEAQKIAGRKASTSEVLGVYENMNRSGSGSKPLPRQNNSGNGKRKLPTAK